jgi:hypothetical protein
MDGWIHQPDKFGMDAVGAAAWPKMGLAAAATNVTSRRKFRCRTFMLSSLSWFRHYMSSNSTPWARALDRADDHNTTTRPMPIRASGSDDPSWMFGSAGALANRFHIGEMKIDETPEDGRIDARETFRRRSDDGLDGPALPRPAPAAVAARAAVHGNGDG